MKYSPLTVQNRVKFRVKSCGPCFIFVGTVQLLSWLSMISSSRMVRTASLSMSGGLYHISQDARSTAAVGWNFLLIHFKFEWVTWWWHACENPSWFDGLARPISWWPGCGINWRRGGQVAKGFWFRRCGWLRILLWGKVLDRVNFVFGIVIGLALPVFDVSANWVAGLE